MPLFRYQAITRDAVVSKGIIDGDSMGSAKERLHKEGLLIEWIELASASTRTSKSFAEAHSLPYRAFVLDLTRDLAQLLGAQLPLYESLLLFRDKYKKHTHAYALVMRLCNRIQEGEKLSSALTHYPRLFNALYLAMIRSGEASGNLADVFQQLDQLLKQQKQVRTQVYGALAYPAFLAVFCVLITGGLLFFYRSLYEGIV